MAIINLDQVKHVLCLGAHSDDIEIGAGGTILKLLEKNPGIAVHWSVFSGKGDRASEARDSAEMFLKNAGASTIEILDFRDGFFPSETANIKTHFEALKNHVDPDLILTHYRDDLHQDHRVICELTWNTFRRHLVLEYEIPKWDGDLGNPNFFVHLEQAHYEGKTSRLMSGFPSQADKHWFSEETFMAIMRIRGLECNAPSHYAEGFYARKVSW